MLLADGQSFGVRSGLLKARALNFLRDEGVGRHNTWLQELGGL